MVTDSSDGRPVEILRELGLKEYESKCFVALTRVPDATAKEVSEISEIPRTRVYDAMRVLETKGLVEVQHANPQRFRAVPVPEAIGTLRDTYEARFEKLEEDLENIQPVQPAADPIAHEVWSLSGHEAITNRTQQLISDADDEIVLILGTGDPLSPQTITGLTNAAERGVDVYLGATDESMRERFAESVPTAIVFESGLDWLMNESETDSDVDHDGAFPQGYRRPTDDDEPAITQLVLVDHNTVLIGSRSPDADEMTEHAVFGRGFSNGLIVILRRILATGLELGGHVGTPEPDGGRDQ